MPKSLLWALVLIISGGAIGVIVVRSTVPAEMQTESSAIARGAVASSQASAAAASEAGFLGVVIASERIDICALNAGRLTAVHVRLGDRVKLGQRLVETYAGTLRAELEIVTATKLAAQADITRAQLTYEQAHARYQRRAELAEGLTSISKEEIETARFESELAVPRLAAAKATFLERSARERQILQELRDSILSAPFDGAIAARFADPGTQVVAGTPILRLIREEGTWVRFAVPQERQAEVKLGDAVDVSVDGDRVALNATVERLAPEVDPATSLLIAEARVTLAMGDRAKMLGRVVRVTPQDRNH
jgi:RND family efflux transporter MFP subunit